MAGNPSVASVASACGITGSGKNNINSRHITIYSEEDLDFAVVAGILTEVAARGLREHVVQRKRTPVADEEPVCLVTGFNDIFVVIASLLMLVSANWVGSTWVSWVGPAVAAVVAWGLAKFFVRKRHMALPAIVLLLAFLGELFALGNPAVHWYLDFYRWPGATSWHL